MVHFRNALPLLVGTATASITTLNKLSKAIEQARRNGTARDPTLRDLPGQSSNFADYFKPYGCWCNFDQQADKIAYGRGEPIDAWDRLCKDLQGGYECAVIDAKARGDSCDPLGLDFAIEDFSAAESAYKMHHGVDPWAWSFTAPADVMQFGVSDPLWRCMVVDDKCKTDVCIAEYWFLMEAWKLIFEQESDFNTASGQPELIENVMTSNSFIDDGFDRDLNCAPRSVNRRGAGKACCGNWPRRHSYKTENSVGNDRSCCETEENVRDFNNNWYNVGTGKVFDSTVLKCCTDGSLTDIGSDC